MRRIGNLTSTYDGSHKLCSGCDGKDRRFLLEAFQKDRRKIAMYELLDHRSFNFHNMPEEKAEDHASLIREVLPDAECLMYQNMTFGMMILHHFQRMERLGVTDILWVQDDEFVVGDVVDDFHRMLDFYRKTPEVKHVSLKYSKERPEFSKVQPRKTWELDGGLLLYELAAADIAPTMNGYGTDMTAFLCDISYFWNAIFDIRVVDFRDAYAVEKVFAAKAVGGNAQRCVTNKQFFESFNIVGMEGSLGRSEESRKQLEDLFS